MDTKETIDPKNTLIVLRIAAGQPSPPDPMLEKLVVVEDCGPDLFILRHDRQKLLGLTEGTEIGETTLFGAVQRAADERGLQIRLLSASTGTEYDLVGGETDEVDTSRQGRENAFLAQLESGLLPWAAHVDLGDGPVPSDEELNADPDLPVFYRIPRPLSAAGRIGGRLVAASIRSMPAIYTGRVSLVFDGWADDGELFKIPEVVDFCRGLLLLDPGRPDAENAKAILQILLDEDSRAFSGETLVEPRWLDLAGRTWVSGMICPEDVYTSLSATRVNRNYSLSLEICRWLMGEGPAPGGN